MHQNAARVTRACAEVFHAALSQGIGPVLLLALLALAGRPAGAVLGVLAGVGLVSAYGGT